MKNQILNFVIATGFAALIANTPVVAQTNHTATIPFTFAAGVTEYPSGAYEIHRMGSAPVVRITNVETRAAHLVPMPIPVDKTGAGSPKLVFQATPDGYKLSEVWLQGSPGMKAYQSSKSSEAASVKVAIR